MARQINRIRTAPPVTPKFSDPLPEDDIIQSSDLRQGSISSGSRLSIDSHATTASRQVSAGRAGMVRTSTAPVNFGGATTTSLHAAAVGRGHNQFSLLAQNFKPFLDASYFVSGGASFASGRTSSNGSFESEISYLSATNSNVSSPVIKEQVNVTVEIMLHDSDEVSFLMSKQLQVDLNEEVHKLLPKLLKAAGLNGISPLHLKLKNQSGLIFSGYLAQHQVDEGCTLEFHVKDTGTGDMDQPSGIDAATLSSANSQSENKVGSSHIFVDKLQKNRLYLAVLLFDVTKRVLMNSRGTLPILEIASDSQFVENFGLGAKEFSWLQQRCFDYELQASEAINAGQDEKFVFSTEALTSIVSEYSGLIEGLSKKQQTNALVKQCQFKSDFYKACLTFNQQLGLKKLGYLYHLPVELSLVEGSQVLVAIQFNAQPIEDSLLKQHDLRWRSARNFNPKYHVVEDDSIWALYLQYYQAKTQRLLPGVYVGLLKCKNTTESLDVLTLKHDNSLIPIVKLKGHSKAASESSTPGSRISQISVASSATGGIGGLVQLSQEENEFVKCLAAKQRGEIQNLPAQFTSSKEYDQLAYAFQKAIIDLGSRTGVPDLNIGMIHDGSYVSFGKDVKVFLLSNVNDLKTQASQSKEKSGGFFSKLAKIALSDSSSTGGTKDTFNEQMLSYVPLALFDQQHHHAFDREFQHHCQQLEKLQLEYLHIESNPTAGQQTTAAAQQKIAEYNEAKKYWNSNQSWVHTLVSQNRELLLKQKSTQK
ncbi:hypothetical protein MIR68_010252 [Amoeboaphelidium protococcarum]|nr:hypothetical protein MIR68_010252 [Amoeboaphelidium protococcarum]